MSTIGFLLSTALLVYALVLIARMLLDWVGVLASGSGGIWTIRARRFTHALTEPVIAPVRRALPPLRLGSVSIDLGFTVVLIGALILRQLAAGW